jgi:hypothetical protein
MKMLTIDHKLILDRPTLALKDIQEQYELTLHKVYYMGASGAQVTDL